jgi:hypothetical protein
VTTEFLNLANPDVSREYAKVVTAIAKDNLPLPLVAINGEVKMAGGVDYYSIVSAIESLTAAAGARPTAAAAPAAS